MPLNSQSLSDLLHGADKVVIGAGAGLSAASGLDYNDEEFFKRSYTPFVKDGINTISEAINVYGSLTGNSALSYWGFWANHINTVCSLTGPLESYKSLYACIKEKEYFVITTNTDGQFFKGGFDPVKVFAPQGRYDRFQCFRGCHDTLYDSKNIVQQMLEGFDPCSLKIREEDIPHCPVCGGLFSPNLRRDHHFVDTPSMLNRENYLNFLSLDKENVLFLELGTGSLSALIISNPFEEMKGLYRNSAHVRIMQKDIQNFLESVKIK